MIRNLTVAFDGCQDPPDYTVTKQEIFHIVMREWISAERKASLQNR